ncbi:MAG TPA: 6-pyruvoyl-tetrahydropterin synthase-related protein [Blastocatellia bacterium]|nr:6-pyruvoyl-tetrahydropterin synthase-related protein [Blastocatellia bacterium]
MREGTGTARFINSIQAVAARGYFPAMVFAALTLAAVIAITPFFFRYRTSEPGFDNRTGMIVSHDMARHFAQAELFHKTLKSGVAYPRWFGEANYGYGIPFTNFYPPGFYFLLSAFYEFIGDWANAMMAVSFLLFIASGIAFYALARLFTGRLASAAASLLYLLFPYHMLNLYWRGAMGELMAFVFIPLTIYFAYKIVTESRARHYAGLGLCYGLYMISHIPTSYLYSYALVFYAVAWAIMSRDIRIAIRIGMGMALGLMVSAIYWLPAVLESKYAQEVVSSIAPYRTSYLTLIESSDQFDRTINALFVLLALTLILVIVFLNKVSRQTNTNGEGAESNERRAKGSLATQMKLWMMIGAGAAFMSTSFSTPISNLIPRIEIATPAWRWLTVSSPFTSLLVGLALERMTEQLRMTQRKLWSWRATIIALTVGNILFTAGAVIVQTFDHGPQWVEKDFTSLSLNPKDATPLAEMPDTPRVVIEPKGEVLQIEKWDPQYRRIRLVLDQPGAVRLRTYYFPGWRARIDGRDAQMSKDKDGAIQIALPAGLHTLEAYFGTTPPRTFGTIFTAIGFFMVLGLAGADYLTDWRKKKAITAIGKKSELAEAATGELVLLDESDHPQQGDVEAQSRGVTNFLTEHWRKIAVVAVVAVIAIMVIKLLSGPPASEKQSGGATGAVAGGADSRLFIRGRDTVPAAVDEKAFEELINALSSRNDANVQALMASGKAIMVPNNTRVRKVQSASTLVQVRILEGEYEGRTVWVLAQLVTGQ